MSRSRDIANLQRNLFKNIIINGNFKIWQRGTGFGFVDGISAYTADRFVCTLQNTNGGGFEVSKGNYNGIDTFKVTVTNVFNDISWDGTTLRFAKPSEYRFEGQHLFSLVQRKSTITISFWFRSNVNGTYSVALQNLSYKGQTGTDDETQYDSYVALFIYNGNGSFEFITITIPLDYTWVYGTFNDERLGFSLVIGAIGDGLVANNAFTWSSGTANNLNGAPYNPIVANGSVNWGSAVGNYIEIMNLQVEEGSIATEFEQIPDDLQLLRCMRYYENTYAKGEPPGFVDPTNYEQGLHLNVGNLSTSHKTLTWMFKQPKRVKPNVRTFSPVSGTDGLCYVGPTTNDENPAQVEDIHEDYCWLAAINDGTNFEWFYVHAEADAEL